MADNLVIFDCDGVLVDSEYVTSRIFAETLTAYGYPISIEDSIIRFTGINEHQCRHLIMHESGIDIPEDYWALQQSKLSKVYESDLKPLLQSVLETIDRLQIPKCVASNSARKHVVQCLEFTDQKKFFSNNSIFTSQQVPRPKPAPDLFLFAAREMGVKPENCIVIEDSSTGAQAAIAAGMQVLLFVGGGHAKFDWYQSLVSIHNKPMLSTSLDLSNAILQAMQIL